MCLLSFLVALSAIVHFMELHTPDGIPIEVNVAEISSIRVPKDSPDAHLVDGVNCVLFMTNGKFISVTETCKQVDGLIAMIEGK